MTWSCLPLDPSKTSSGDRVAEPLLDVVAEQDDGKGEDQAQPKLVPEHGDRVARMIVVPSRGRMPVPTHGRGRRSNLEVLRPPRGAGLVMLVVIHQAPTR